MQNRRDSVMLRESYACVEKCHDDPYGLKRDSLKAPIMNLPAAFAFNGVSATRRIGIVAQCCPFTKTGCKLLW
uniref:Uncharacterized protein n=1 Tax=Ascaris lumbricoides TaxID=6252 RepID=A0A0M3HZ89_ASCLU